MIYFVLKKFANQHFERMSLENINKIAKYIYIHCIKLYIFILCNNVNNLHMVLYTCEIMLSIILKYIFTSDLLIFLDIYSIIYTRGVKHVGQNNFTKIVFSESITLLVKY